MLIIPVVICIVLFYYVVYYAQYLIFGDCSIDICLLYCIVFVCCVSLCVMCFFLTSFMSDCCMTEFVDLRNDMCQCVCMYVCLSQLDTLTITTYAIIIFKLTYLLL